MNEEYDVPLPIPKSGLYRWNRDSSTDTAEVLSSDNEEKQQPDREIDADKSTGIVHQPKSAVRGLYTFFVHLPLLFVVKEMNN